MCVSVRASVESWNFYLGKLIMALVLVSLPARFRIGSEWHNYVYRSIYETIVLLICQLSAFQQLVHCLLFNDLCCVALKQLGRRREEVGVPDGGFFECVRGTDKDNIQRVLYLFRAQEAAGMQWVAVHGPPGASYDEVAMATPVFGSADENMLTGDAHEWHWHPCVL